MKAMKKQNPAKNERGMATIEMLPLIFVFIFLLSYVMGAFGIIHTGIKNSISARTYAFETFRNRSNLVYFRDTPVDQADLRQYKTNGNRQHAIMSEERDAETYVATERPIRIGITTQPNASRNDPDIHVTKVFDTNLIGTKKRNQQVEVSPAWIMIQYGICLNNRCGDSQ